MTSRLPADADVVIIGGGVMGTSTAFHLAEAGDSNVLLLEADQLASGSTSKAAGGIRAQFSDELNIALALRSLDAFEQFHERPGADIDLHQDGYLFLLTTPEDVATFERSVELQNRCGVPSRMISPSEAKTLSPLIAIDDVLAAAFCGRDGRANPEAVVHGYAAGARRHGVRIVSDCRVTGIVTAGSSITAVHTEHGVVRTHVVVAAAGPWSREVGAMAGVDLPVHPVRRPIWYTEPIADLPPNCPMTIDFSTGFYFHPDGRGLLFGMADAQQAPGFDAPLQADWLEQVGAVAARRAPALTEVGIAGGWTGFYEVSPDHNAMIGEMSTPSRFLYATGFSGHGFLQGPAVGEVMADLILRRTPRINVGPLSVDRFTQGTARPEHNIV